MLGGGDENEAGDAPCRSSSGGGGGEGAEENAVAGDGRADCASEADADIAEEPAGGSAPPASLTVRRCTRATSGSLSTALTAAAAARACACAPAPALAPRAAAAASRGDAAGGGIGLSPRNLALRMTRPHNSEGDGSSRARRVCFC